MSPEALQSRLQQLTLDLAIEGRKIQQTGVQSKKVKVREMKRTRAQILTLLKEKGVNK